MPFGPDFNVVECRDCGKLLPASKTWCGYCPQCWADHKGRSHSEIDDLYEELDAIGAIEEEEEVGSPKSVVIAAKFSSRCACGFMVHPGELIRWDPTTRRTVGCSACTQFSGYKGKGEVEEESAASLSGGAPPSRKKSKAKEKEKGEESGRSFLTRFRHLEIPEEVKRQAAELARKEDEEKARLEEAARNTPEALAAAAELRKKEEEAERARQAEESRLREALRGAVSFRGGEARRLDEEAVEEFVARERERGLSEWEGGWLRIGPYEGEGPDLSSSPWEERVAASGRTPKRCGNREVILTDRYRVYVRDFGTDWCFHLASGTGSSAKLELLRLQLPVVAVEEALASIRRNRA